MKFEFTLDEINVIMAALGKAPYEAVAGVIANIQKQAQPQLEQNGIQTRDLPKTN
jgi:hypothetical protein